MVENELTHVEYLLFVDEVGNNTNQKDDKTGNKKFVGQKGHGVQQSCDTDVNRFTVLVWTAYTGEVAMVAVIFHGEMLRAE